MFFELKYQLKSSKKEVIEKYYNRNEVLDIIKQLNRGLTPIKNNLINGISSLKYINIYEQNYEYIDENGFHYGYKEINNNGEFIEIPELSLNLDDNFKPNKIEITAKLFYENNIGILGNEDIIYNNGILVIKGEVFTKLSNTTKYGEMIDLIYKTKDELGNEFGYTELLEQYEIYKNNYKKLTKNDFTYEKVRNTLKDKLEEIRKHFKMKKDIIKLDTETIIVTG